jgi:hypothetical protein
MTCSPSWAADLGVTAHWLRHTTLTDIERLAGLCVASTTPANTDTSTGGVIGRDAKASPAELRLALSPIRCGVVSNRWPVYKSG